LFFKAFAVFGDLSSRSAKILEERAEKLTEDISSRFSYRSSIAAVTREAKRTEVARDLRCVFNAPDRAEADRLLKIAVEKYREGMPPLADWMEENVPDALTVFSLPQQHRRRLRTTNLLERLNKEIKRRTRVATLFPNDASVLRLVASILMETNDDWLGQSRYLNISPEEDRP